MKKEFISKVKNVAPSGRSKRSGASAASGGSSAYVYMPTGGVQAAAGGQGHTHSNKADLDSLSTDTEGYVYITRYAEIVNEETGEVEVKLITEKIKAAHADHADYAEVANDLTENSPVNKRFLSRLLDDMAQGFITFCKGLKSSARAIFGNFIAGSDGAMIDPNGDAEFNEVIARKRLTVGPPVVPGVSGGGLWVDEFGNTHLQVDFAEVTKRATFAEVEVKKLRHVGGVIILSPASMECSAVEELSDVYRCYFDTESELYPGKVIANEFRVGDLARSQTCNLAEGVTLNASNRYYWRKVVGIGPDYIDLSKTDCDPAGVNDVPAPGDSIIQMGNAFDPQRQNLIIIAAYGSESPYIYQFQDIDDYTLPDKKCKTKISPYGNRFTGELIVETATKNQSIADYVDDRMGLYRLVAEADNIPATDADGNSDVKVRVRCLAYRIEGGDMIPLEFNSSFGFMGAGGNLLSLGGSLLHIGEVDEDPELLTLTRTTYRYQASEDNLVADGSVLYNGKSYITPLGDFVKVVFTLYRNGEKVAEAVVGGTEAVNMTRARFSVLNDRVTSEVERIGQSISTIEQTADRISLKVDRVNAAAGANLARGTMSPDAVQTFNPNAANTTQFPFEGITVDNPQTLVTISFDFALLTTFTSSSGIGSGYSLGFAMGSHFIGSWIQFTSLEQSIFNNLIMLSGRFSATVDLSADPAETLTLFAMVRPDAVVKVIGLSGLRVNIGSTALPWQAYAGETEQRIHATGIDIEHQKITLTADNVAILNNAGKPTASFDADGEFCAHRLIAKNAAGKTIAAMNADGQGEYTIYYPDTGKRRMQISPTADRANAMVYYDTDGQTALWTLGASGISYLIEQRFVKVAGYYTSNPAQEAPLYQFIASENSPNREYNGLYFTKDQTGNNDLTQERASGTYYSMTTEPDATGQKRHFMIFVNGKLSSQGYLPAAN